MIIQIMAAFAATVAFSLLFNVPKKQYFYCGLTGAIGWFFYLCSNTIFSVVTASFIATVFITTFSRFFAVVRKTPITVFLISGIFPIVPGAGIYYASYYLIMNDTILANAKGLETVKIACAIALGIVVVLAIPYKYFALSLKFSKSKKGMI